MRYSFYIITKMGFLLVHILHFEIKTEVVDLSPWLSPTVQYLIGYDNLRGQLFRHQRRLRFLFFCSLSGLRRPFNQKLSPFFVSKVPVHSVRRRDTSQRMIGSAFNQ
jgi:hypothetical protein